MAFQIPMAPWIPREPGSQVAEMYATGVKTGVAIASERARLQQAAAENAMQVQMANARLAQQTQMQHESLEQRRRENEAELAVKRAYNDSMVAIRDRDLAEKQAKNRMATEKAARLYAAQQRFGAMMQGGGKLENAIYQNPELLSPGLLTALQRGQAGARNYGKPIVEDIPGLKGTKMIYREGSPGVHIAKETATKPQLTPAQQAQIERDIGRLIISKSNFPPGDEQLAAINEQIRRLEAIAKGATTAPAPPVPGTSTGTTAPPAPTRSTPAPTAATGLKYPEGTVLKKKDGTRYVVANGMLVPYTVEDSTEQYPEER